MELRRFFLFSVAGCVTWATLMVLDGYWLGRVARICHRLLLLSLEIVVDSKIPVGVQWPRETRYSKARIRVIPPLIGAN